MDWVRADVDIMRDPEMVMAGRDAFLMYMHGLLYAGEQETDGFVPIGILSLCPWVKSGDAAASKLSVARLHDEPLWIPGSDGYTIRGYGKKQPTKADLEAARAADEKRRNEERDRKAKWRASRGVSRAVSRGTSGESPPQDTGRIRDDTGQEREDQGLDLNGQVGLGGGPGEPDRSAADQDQDPDQAVIGQFTPVLGDRLAFVWAKVRRSGGAAWKNVIPEVFADLATTHGPEPVASAIEALSLMDPGDLQAVEKPRGYVVQTVIDHASKVAATIKK